METTAEIITVLLPPRAQRGFRLYTCIGKPTAIYTSVYVYVFVHIYMCVCVV